MKSGEINLKVVLLLLLLFKISLLHDLFLLLIYQSVPHVWKQIRSGFSVVLHNSYPTSYPCHFSKMNLQCQNYVDAVTKKYLQTTPICGKNWLLNKIYYGKGQKPEAKCVSFHFMWQGTTLSFGLSLPSKHKQTQSKK